MPRFLRHLPHRLYRQGRLMAGLFLLYAALALGDTSALDRLQQRAEQGESQAQLALAKRYANGIELPRNPPLAVEWLTKAATQNDVEAQFYLGWLYTHGKGVPQDDLLAFTWIGCAAQQNDAQAQYWLARFYQHGVGPLSIGAWRITGTKRPALTVWRSPAAPPKSPPPRHRHATCH